MVSMRAIQSSATSATEEDVTEARTTTTDVRAPRRVLTSARRDATEPNAALMEMAIVVERSAVRVMRDASRGVRVPRGSCAQVLPSSVMTPQMGIRLSAVAIFRIDQLR